VWLNGRQTVDHAVLENGFDPEVKNPAPQANPRPVPRLGPVQLPVNGEEVRWRNVCLREISSEEANRILSLHGGGEGWKPIFNGQDLSGWQGPLEQYEVRDGAIFSKGGGTLHTVETFSNFKVRLEYKLPHGGNNGLAIRYPGSGNTAYVGMCEIQVLDDDDPKHANLQPYQYNGSIYGMVPAHRGYLRPIGEWNFQEVTVDGSKICVELNGTVIVNTDVSKITEPAVIKHHPGISRTSGFFGFAGHGKGVAFRLVQVLRLK
jgi:hypothetical protein